MTEISKNKKDYLNGLKIKNYDYNCSCTDTTNVFRKLETKLEKTTQDLQYALTLLYSLGSVGMIGIILFIYLHCY